MKFIKGLVIVLVLLAAIIVGVGYLLPSEYRVERTVIINAPSADIHKLVGDLERWPEWSPWERDDPSIKITRRGKTTGIGASQSWSGDSGSGELTFTSSSPETGIGYDLSFDEGAFRCEAAMQYQAEGASTKVTWWMSGDVGGNLIGRYIALVMDRMAGPMFEDGLARLKSLAEKK